MRVNDKPAQEEENFSGLWKNGVFQRGFKSKRERVMLGREKCRMSKRECGARRPRYGEPGLVGGLDANEEMK
jgi:hypothetical protein